MTTEQQSVAWVRKLRNPSARLRPAHRKQSAKILEMIGPFKGATLAQTMQATDLQAHSVRGFISTAARKRNVTIESSKSEAGDRIYTIAK